MDEELERVSRALALAIRTLLKSRNEFDRNYRIDFNLGRYHISYTRTSGRENEVIDLPDDLLEIFRNCIIELDQIWFELGRRGRVD